MYFRVIIILITSHLKFLKYNISSNFLRTFIKIIAFHIFNNLFINVLSSYDNFIKKSYINVIVSGQKNVIVF